jgi:hypothetical protein
LKPIVVIAQARHEYHQLAPRILDARFRGHDTAEWGRNRWNRQWPHRLAAGSADAAQQVRNTGRLCLLRRGRP